MSNQLNHSRIVRVTRRNSCLICDHADWCSITDDGALAFCMRVEAGSFKTARNGAYIHRLAEAPQSPRRERSQRPAQQAVKRANLDAIVAVYADLLRRHLVLSEEHRLQLRARGLSDLAIEVNGYRSTPPPLFAANVARALARNHDLRGVPGFYRERGAWRMVWMDEGIIIPVRDPAGRAVALMYRRTHFDKSPEFGKYIWISSGEDKEGRPREGGASSGAPCHWAKPHLLQGTHEVTLTEGALKADLVAHFLNQPVIGNAPSCFGADFAANLKAEFPKLRTIFVAFDNMEVEHNDHVNNALFRLVEQLERARFSVRVRTWPPPWKGIDDYLLAVSQREIAA